MKRHGFDTRAIHTGQEPDPYTGSITVPIHQTSTYAQDAVGQDRGYEYSRTGNPTRTALEVCLADLEDAEFGFAFASGMAAEDAILRLLGTGDHLIMGDDAYGGTYRLISQVLARTGVEWTAVHLSDPDALAAAWRPNTKMVWVESPTNPLLGIVDIAAVADAASAHGAVCVVDNTFATPYLQLPLNLGAQIVVHSTTKYLGGHSDVVGGFAATNSVEVADHLGFIQNAAGAVPGPLDCFLTLRGVKTLGLRMERHCHTAAAVARLLEDHQRVRRVLYPGLVSHPGHHVAAAQMSGFGGMVSFTLSDEETAKRLVGLTDVFTLAESLGAVESLIEHPAEMTHASAADSPLEVDPTLIRLSVGIESEEDLLDDLTRALDRL